MEDSDMTRAKEELRDKLYERDGYACHYCGIAEGKFLDLWKEFYGLPYRGRRLEIDHKDAVVIKGGAVVKRTKDQMEDNPESCVLACALCNMAKSNMFTHEEFKGVGEVVRRIWQKREKELRTDGSNRPRPNGAK
jgi:5-methylcytosine-specific restriction endonuclease McrA